MQHPDQKYIDALLHNDTALLKELYEKFLDKITSLVVQNNGSETDAVDIFQEALLSIFNKAKSKYFVLTCPFEAFLYVICKNSWMNELDKRKSHKTIFHDTDKYSNLGEDNFRLTEQCVLQQARRDLMTAKLSALGESCRRLLELNWSGKSLEEVAAILDVSYGYVRKKKSECMAKLVMAVKQSAQFNSLKW